LEIPTGVPLVYQLNSRLQPIPHPNSVAPLSGVFLGDAAAVAEAQRAVAEQSASNAEGGGDDDDEEEGINFLCVGSGCLMLSNEEMRAAFDEIDADSNGLIDQYELKAVVDTLAQEDDEADADADMTVEQVEALIKMVDRNGDGLIDFEEFVQALTAEREPANV